MMADEDSAPYVIVVVLHWNNWRETTACLKAISQLEYPNCSALVIDNGSIDGSGSQIHRQHPGIELIETGSNLGYAAGNNFGIRHALTKNPRYILLLNNDTQIASDALQQLVNAAEADPGAAMLGPKVLHLDDPTKIQSAGAHLDYLWRSQQRYLDQPQDVIAEKVEPVDYLIGAAVLVRTAILDKVGMLDSDYFMYREDVDWCLRARNLGYRVLYVPTARVWHRNHQHVSRDQARTTYYMTRNSLLLIQKRGGGNLRLLAVLARHMMTAVAWSLRPKWSHKRADRNALIRGIVDFLRRRTGMWDCHDGSQSIYGASEAG